MHRSVEATLRSLRYRAVLLRLQFVYARRVCVGGEASDTSTECSNRVCVGREASDTSTECSKQSYAFSRFRLLSTKRFGTYALKSTEDLHREVVDNSCVCPSAPAWCSDA
ncbi:unnamed protein product [Rangifer tarandus platyrhynchus]|uniref:Secreted protein n=1 Tax=Rangifer tarandus platyrhynchus TaxID=3082113 RepID=A0ABN8XMM5_RANTA|nr:unnamed protein product [Rangifer tarandus platyrhynchus]